MSESKYVELKLIESNWIAAQKESSSNFQRAENQILIGRKHSGDEN